MIPHVLPFKLISVKCSKSVYITVLSTHLKIGAFTSEQYLKFINKITVFLTSLIYKDLQLKSLVVLGESGRGDVEVL